MKHGNDENITRRIDIYMYAWTTGRCTDKLTDIQRNKRTDILTERQIDIRQRD